MTTSPKMIFSESSNLQDSDIKMVRDIFLRSAPRTKMQNRLLKFTKMIGLSIATRYVEDTILQKRFRASWIVVATTPAGRNKFHDLWKGKK